MLKGGDAALENLALGGARRAGCRVVAARMAFGGAGSSLAAQRGAEQREAVADRAVAALERRLAEIERRLGSAESGFYRIDVQSGSATRIDQGHEIRELTGDGENFYSPGGPDKRQIVVTSVRSGESHLTYQNDGYVGSLALSPDGRRIAFVSGEFSDDRPSPLRVVELATGIVRKLDEGRYHTVGSNMAWSPDGKFLLARGPRGSKNKDALALIPVDGGPVKDVAGTGLSSNTNSNSLAFHPDGKSISWTSSRNENHYWALE